MFLMKAHLVNEFNGIVADMPDEDWEDSKAYDKLLEAPFMAYKENIEEIDTYIKQHIQNEIDQDIRVDRQRESDYGMEL